MSENNIVRLNKGDKAPNFELESDEYKHYALADFKHQNVVLYFYPKAGTSVCTREAKDSATTSSVSRPKDMPSSASPPTM